ncbi:MAG: hypothetical protein JNJ61_25625 [Anaerolineae bacterium]|nr:hypothetical protein [Anaerolineae bacterium]
MSRTIHGRSTAALKHLREAPAALAVYWCYVARMNNEGVAWPSTRGLKNDTGWNRESCMNGRDLLVKLGAIEQVKDYIRPEWRNLPPAQLKQKQNLDKSEYYRPTGKLLMGEQMYFMLYNGGDEPNSIDAPPPSNASSDGLRRRPSAAPTIDAADRRPDRPELNSTVSELDSTLSMPPTTTAAATPPESTTEHGSDPEPVIQKQPQSKKPRKRDPVFDAITQHVFNLEADSLVPKAISGRAAKLRRAAVETFLSVYKQREWTGELAEKCAKSISMFVSSWQTDHSEDGISLPQGEESFATNYLSYLQSVNASRIAHERRQAAAAAAPKVKQYLTPEERAETLKAIQEGRIQRGAAS